MGSKPAPPPGGIFTPKLSKADAKRTRILEAALKSIGKYGMRETSFASVGKLAKMEPAHVAYYFKSRDLLVHSAAKLVIVTAQQTTLQEVLKATNIKGQIHAIVKGAFTHLRKYPEHRFVVALLASEATRDTGLLAMSRAARQTGFERVQGILAQVGKQGLARAVHAVVTGFVVDAIARDLSGPALDEAESEALHAIDLLF